MERLFLFANDCEITRAEKIADNALKPLLQKAIKEDREVKSTGPRLSVEGELFKYEHKSGKVCKKWKK